MSASVPAASSIPAESPIPAATTYKEKHQENDEEEV
jgi:hypothetical protein